MSRRRHSREVNPSAGREKPGSVSGGLPRGVQFWHRGSLCRRKRKRPRDLRSEGVVKPRRSGWPISAGRYQAVVSWSSLPNARASTSMRRHGSSLAMATECAFKGSFQWLLKRGAHDKPRFIRAQPFCSIIFFFTAQCRPAAGTTGLCDAGQRPALQLSLLCWRRRVARHPARSATRWLRPTDRAAARRWWR